MIRQRGFTQHHKNGTGFTLIELLVVIAIIGILSSVVLASLNTARSKGNDAAVKANLNTVGAQAALYLSDNNDYGTFNNGTEGIPGTCPAVGVSGTSVFHNPTIEMAIAAALASAPSGVTACHSNGSAYAVAVSRPDIVPKPSTYWCVDSTGMHCGISSNSLPGAACVCASDQ